MNRIFPSIESIFVGIYYAAIFLTPANVRGAGRLIGTLGSRIADCVRKARLLAPQTTLILGAAMFASAPGLGQTSPDAQSAIIPNQGPQSAISSAALPQDMIVLRREGNEALY